MQGLGNAARLAKDYKKAEEYYNQAVVLWARKLPATRHSIAILKRDIAQLHYEQKDYEEAFQLISESLNILESEQSGNFWDQTASLNLLGIILADKGEKKKAVQLFEHLIESLDNIGVQEEALIHPLINLGELYFGLQEFAKADEVFHRLNKILTPYKEQNPDTFLYCSVRLAQSQEGQAQRTAALQTASQSLAFAKGKKFSKAGEEHIRTAEALVSRLNK
jgi:tetratricopeptide (TPR) repeat protein